MNVDFDSQRIDRLKQLLGAGFPAMADTFRETVARSFTEFEAARGQGDLASAREIAHRMRSTFAQFGAVGASAAAERYEYHRDGEDEGALALAMHARYDAVLPVLSYALDGGTA